jgi:hypothetical protein
MSNLELKLASSQDKLTSFLESITSKVDFIAYLPDSLLLSWSCLTPLVPYLLPLSQRSKAKNSSSLYPWLYL